MWNLSGEFREQGFLSCGGLVPRTKQLSVCVISDEIVEHDDIQIRNIAKAQIIGQEARRAATQSRGRVNRVR